MNEEKGLNFHWVFCISFMRGLFPPNSRKWKNGSNAFSVTIGFFLQCAQHNVSQPGIFLGV